MELSNKSAMIRFIIYIVMLIISMTLIYFSGINPDNIPMIACLVSFAEFLLCFLCPGFKKKANKA